MRWADASETVWVSADGLRSGTADDPFYIAHVAGGGSVADYEAPPPSADDVKAEAYRRITAVYPAWKQMNIIARAAELDRIQSGRMRNTGGNPVPPRPLDPEEVAEEQATAAAWTWIKSIRAASDALEAMDPIPADYATNDAYWTA